MTDLERKILEETERFREAIPSLAQEIGGKWVVFKDGEVKSHHETADEAYIAAVENFGVEGGFVVAPVVAMKPTPVSASVCFGVE